ncbi:gliding motility-associated C-terminal domain-containing protein [Cytophagaceae bacterium DM2B3-1]|uniref:Gliding motility-associated C-terminal domain-containing protein n=1 Tax=Xanthocytophaga flava TaxID=3048013 RepID=A0ABT7CIM9_9BACT|nr:gliding motility-associated C-terminal domain-containing protein [Xanthocytophaga flavus]MDJ1468491.1 gliding motility-associated C-terminal domain-containing protein [Xanthocytophaga flavus]MDJ1493386.1 gliding motility-associated C-terminal domain-containing protein [Xanthocytophaga flavus]
MNRMLTLLGGILFCMTETQDLLAIPFGSTYTHTTNLERTYSFQTPVVTLGDSILALQGTEIEIKGSVSSDVVTLKWEQLLGPSEATLENADALTVHISNLKEGTYKFSLTGTNSNGESATAAIEVRVTTNPSGAYVLVPKKIFTPNGDGFNDTWDIQYISTRPNYTVIIMDSKGKKLVEKTNFTSDEVWDGQGAGYGAYYYVIKDENQKEYRTGSFSLLQ